MIFSPRLMIFWSRWLLPIDRYLVSRSREKTWFLQYEVPQWIPIFLQEFRVPSLIWANRVQFFNYLDVSFKSIQFCFNLRVEEFQIWAEQRFFRCFLSRSISMFWFIIPLLFSISVLMFDDFINQVHNIIGRSNFVWFELFFFPELIQDMGRKNGWICLVRHRKPLSVVLSFAIPEENQALFWCSFKEKLTCIRNSINFLE